MSPYRQAAKIPLEPKPKRQFKMPSIKLGKFTKTFGYIMPVGGSSVGIGIIYDAPLLGLGLKWGSAVALVLCAIFFAGMALRSLEAKEY
jgi:hypothetical protein